MGNKIEEVIQLAAEHAVTGNLISAYVIAHWHIKYALAEQAFQDECRLYDEYIFQTQAALNRCAPWKAEGRGA